MSEHQHKQPQAPPEANVYDTSLASVTFLSEQHPRLQATTNEPSQRVGTTLLASNGNVSAEQHTICRTKQNSGWEVALDPETGRNYYVDHNTKTTQWFDPRDR